MRKLFMGLFILCTTTSVIAQQTLNNDAIVKMVKAGLSDSVVVATIQASTGQYDTSTDALVALKGAGVDDTVVGAMISKSVAPTTTVAGTTAAASADPNNPDSPHEAVHLGLSPE